MKLRPSWQQLVSKVGHDGARMTILGFEGEYHSFLEERSKKL